MVIKPPSFVSNSSYNFNKFACFSITSSLFLFASFKLIEYLSKFFFASINNSLALSYNFCIVICVSWELFTFFIFIVLDVLKEDSAILTD